MCLYIYISLCIYIHTHTHTHTHTHMLKWGFPGGSDGKESACNAEDRDLIPGLGRSPKFLTYSSILAGESPWTGDGRATVHRVAKNWTLLSNRHAHIY